MNVYYQQALGHRKASSYSSWMICDITITHSIPAQHRIISHLQQQQQEVRTGSVILELVWK
jgi:hypothetical protein